MAELDLIRFFRALWEYESSTDSVRQVLMEKCTDLEALFEVVLDGHHTRINRNCLIQFLALESPQTAQKLAKAVPIFLEVYSQSSELDLKQFERFVMAKRVNYPKRMYAPQKYQLKYSLYLLFVEQIQNCKAERQKLDQLNFRQVLRILFPADIKSIQIKDVNDYFKRSKVSISVPQLQLLWRRLGRLCRRKRSDQITIKQFNNLMKAQSVLDRRLNLYRNDYNPSEGSPLRSAKQEPSKNSERSTAVKTSDKKYLKLELQEMSKQVKKKLVYEVSLKQVMVKKVLAFLIAACRRDKQINALKTELFAKSKPGIGRFFSYLDKTKSEFLTGQQLSDFFQDTTNMFVFFYGSEGIIRFSDFCKLVTPLSITLHQLQKCIENELQSEILQDIGVIFKKMAEAQAANLRELEVLSGEFKIKDKAQLLQMTIFLDNPLLTFEELSGLFEHHSMLISEIELQLLFRKLDRECDSRITIEDFSPYIYS